MLFVIDVGNSQTVPGLYEGDTLRAHWRVSTIGHRTADELRILLTMLLRGEGIAPEAVTGCCISSVVPQLNAALLQVSQDMFHVDPVMIGPGVKTGLVIQVDNPREVGADRIVNAVAAVKEYGTPLIIIDLGTATTLDAISEQAEYRGGVILPGIFLASDVLFERCAQLPRVELTVPPAVIGRNTVTCIQAGLTYGYAELVDGLIGRMAAEMGGSPKVIATGGLANVIAGVARKIDTVDPLLTLKGLKAVFDRNATAGPRAEQP